MAEKLHSLDMLSSKTFEQLSNLQGMNNDHLASVLVQELSHDLKDKNKYNSLLSYLKMENAHVYYEILHHSELLSLILSWCYMYLDIFGKLSITYDNKKYLKSAYYIVTLLSRDN